MIFGFKLRYLRLKYHKSYQQLSELTGLSTSYLNDIEKGKKYPKPDKIQQLAEAFGLSYDDLVSTHSDKRIQPVIDMVNSDFFARFPMDEFGISPEKLLDVFTNAPDKITAFISTVVKIVRSYQIEKEDFNRVALRSYQDIHNNYFDSIEKASKVFRKENRIKLLIKDPNTLERLLIRKYNYRIDRTELAKNKELKQLRFFVDPEHQVLFLNPQLSDAQQSFVFAKEIGFQVLELDERPFETKLNKEASFEKLLNNFKASYFAIALLIDIEELTADISRLTQTSKLEIGFINRLLIKYMVTPEMLLQRLTNILPHQFGIDDLFFFKLNATRDKNRYEMAKELHLSRIHTPYNNQLNEHLCQRWVSITTIKKLGKSGQNHLVEAQISQYQNPDQAYFCLTVAQKNSFNDPHPSSVTIGLLLNADLRATFPFLRDPALATRIVDTTCERCPIADCEDRVAPPWVVEQAAGEDRLEAALEELKSRSESSVE